MALLPTQWLREPLVHFAVLGAAIFLADAALAPIADAGRSIEVTPAVHDDLLARFQQVEGRPPSAGELDRMIDGWVLQEVLYRHGRALGLDQGDAIIRDRVVQRMTVLLQNSVVVDPPEDEALRAWFEAHRERFDTPPRFDFVAKQVKGGEAEARVLAEALRRALETGEGRVEPEGPVARYTTRPRPNVVALFGETFAAQLEALPEFQWQAVAAPQGWHVVRLDGFWPAEAAEFTAVRAAVAADWQRAVMAEEAQAALREMAAGYNIVRPDTLGPAARAAASGGSDG
ncbi:MAG: peptidylprolyl isomerase [Kiloniellaceae bacterium]